MKASDLRERTDEELQDLYADTSREMFDLKVKKMSGDTSQAFVKIRELRRDLARIQTVQTERKNKRPES
jgi:ribosomal protein L29